MISDHPLWKTFSKKAWWACILVMMNICMTWNRFTLNWFRLERSRMYRGNKSSWQTSLNKRLKRDWLNCLDWKSWFVCPTCPSKAGLRKQIFHISDQFSKSHSYSLVSPVLAESGWLTHFCQILLIKSLTIIFSTRSQQLQLTSTWTST